MVIVNESDKIIFFNNLADKLDKLYEWELISKTAKQKQKYKVLKYYYIGCRNNYVECDIVGYIPYPKSNGETAVISIESSLCKIMPAHLKEMQMPNFKSNSVELT